MAAAYGMSDGVRGSSVRACSLVLRNE